ncbi:hypothetical protein NITLEN_80083 [Nitrospira lenta]|uniref:Lon proteolytic domain-containing protein n=2 Tax=Nitrospira lenta TaxID=1436998 RepID=A0A330LA81_9BACT|nr:hypothetical protein NITLEN_80083 [Nitrospira lenta]
MREPQTYSSLEVIPAPILPQSQAVLPPESKTTAVRAPAQILSQPAPFSDVSLTVPVLSILVRPRAGSITGSWSGLVARLIVGYRADGKGPDVVPNMNLMPVSAESLRTAVAVAARAVGYDSRYVTVRLLIPVKMDGPSAGGIMAVGIAAALLGDPIRQDICMSGTIEPTLEIKPVGRLVDKMNACRDLKKTTMIVPDGLDNSHLSFTGSEKAIHVIEVHTLAEAYSAATGQVLRQAGH